MTHDFQTKTKGEYRLPPQWIGRVKGGYPAIALSECAELGEHQIGDAFSLLDEAGTQIGIGVYDPENEVLRTMPAAAEETFDGQYFLRRVRAAAKLRQRVGLIEPESAYRLVNAEGDGLPGILVDVYAGHVLISTYSSAWNRYLSDLATAIESAIQVKSMIQKVHPPGGTPSGRVEFSQLSAEVPPRQLQVVENGLKYEVHLQGGLNTGLFCDMREVRRALAPWTRGKTVLNTFCYTGSFSVVAAHAGARSVTSIDFASGVLQWTKTNFKLNNLPTAKHHFVRGDVFDFLKAERRKDKLYDVIVLDPPATTTVPGRRWYLKSDYDRLIGHALNVTAPGGLLVIAASSVESRPEKLEKQIREAARDRGRRLRLVESFGQPADYPTQMIYPQARYLKCYFVIAD